MIRERRVPMAEVRMAGRRESMAAEARRRGIPPLMEATRARPALRMSARMTFRLRATAALAVAVLWTAPVRSTCWSARI